MSGVLTVALFLLRDPYKFPSCFPALGLERGPKQLKAGVKGYGTFLIS